ncbi:MAG: hypothetical protein COB66_01470 [Coxiella sp. (in: Bacteria)]|nr:MAG: hypothetical protein COB66_01470 [Coxiella sp. (in: g-proteobacteria)]
MDIPDTDLNNSILESLGGEPTEPAEAFVETEQNPGITKVGAKEGNTHSTGATTSVEEKALTLLGSGIRAEAVAAALGVTPARISQLLADKEFSGKVSELRYENLQSHNKRDSSYDSIEDDLLVKLKRSVPLMVKPDTILRAISVVNAAKRRGQSAPEQVTNQTTMVTLILPNVIAQKFTTTIDNQVITAGEQSLVTMQSGDLLSQVKSAQARKLEQAMEAAEPAETVPAAPATIVAPKNPEEIYHESSREAEKREYIS